MKKGQHHPSQGLTQNTGISLRAPGQSVPSKNPRQSVIQTPPGFKQTEVGVIPEDWETQDLGSIAEVVMGQSPVGTSYNQNGVGVPLINGPTEFTDKYPIKKQWTTQPTKICKAGDLLLCVRGSSTGRMNISNDEYCIGRGVAAIQAKPGADNTFITFQLDWAIQKLLALSAGSTFPNVDGKSIRSIPVPFPPYPNNAPSRPR